jgi:hypothetical protein
MEQAREKNRAADIPARNSIAGLRDLRSEMQNDEEFLAQPDNAAHASIDSRCSTQSPDTPIC